MALTLYIRISMMLRNQEKTKLLLWELLRHSCLKPKWAQVLVLGQLYPSSILFTETQTVSWEFVKLSRSGLSHLSCGKIVLSTGALLNAHQQLSSYFIISHVLSFIIFHNISCFIISHVLSFIIIFDHLPSCCKIVLPAGLACYSTNCKLKPQGFRLFFDQVSLRPTICKYSI